MRPARHSLHRSETREFTKLKRDIVCWTRLVVAIIFAQQDVFIKSVR
jgi:hypothetical protein